MYGKMPKSGFIEVFPLVCTLTGQYPDSLHPDSPEGAQLGAAAVAEGLMTSASFVYWWQAAFFVNTI